MIIDFIDIHKIFLFLGTLEGELVKKVFELILFLLITYMVISEYSRDQRRDLKYLIAGFSALSFEKIVSTIVLAGVLFGKLGATTYNSYFPVIDHLLETLALVLMVNAFLFPIIIKKIKSAKKVILSQLTIIGSLYLIFQTALLTEILYIKIPNADFTNHFAGLIFTLIKIILLLYAVYFLSTRTDIRYKYRYSVIIAFLVYLVTPLWSLIIS